jgi:hypothetical protein
LLVALTSACSYYARGPEDYRKVTRDLLETRQAEIKNCYEDAAKEEGAEASGTVVVNFKVEAETGKIKDAKALPESSAPQELTSCVLTNINGLELDPPDQREGDATFTYEFK